MNEIELESYDVVSSLHISSIFNNRHSTRYGVLAPILRRLLKRGGTPGDLADRLLEEGIECEVIRRASHGDSQKGRLHLLLKFIPDEPDSELAKSPLAVRRELGID